VQTANPSFNIRAVLNGTGTGSVLFGYNVIPRYRVEHIEPFAFCSNIRTRYRKCDKLGVGTHTITATPFSGQAALGQSGTPLSLTFHVVAACPSVESYINSITLSGRVLSLSGTTPEDKAMQWLASNDPLKLTPCTEVDKFRLRQRFALLTFGFQELENGQLIATAKKWFIRSNDECQWDLGIICGTPTRTRVDYMVPSSGGTLPADYGLLSSLTMFLGSNRFLGSTLPSSIMWTNLTQFLASSSLEGTSCLHWKLDKLGRLYDRRQRSHWDVADHYWTLEKAAIVRCSRQQLCRPSSNRNWILD
jgi:hypothetical protein